MHIVGGSTYLEQQAARLHKAVARLHASTPALMAAGVAGWAALLAIVVFDVDAGFLSWLFAGVGLLSLLALLAPRWQAALADEADKYEAGLYGEQKLADLLATRLGDEWTLFRNLRLPDYPSDIDAILLGQQAIFVLEIKYWAGTFQNDGSRWMRRGADNAWVEHSSSPTEQVLAHSEALVAFLGAHGLSVIIQNRIVWAGDGILLSDKPDAPIWWLKQVEPVWDDIEDGVGISAEQSAIIHSLLIELQITAEEGDQRDAILV